ncbi:MAG: hypothetical protein ACFE0J_26045 [Elainellaceae cyanobacterium]
MWKMTDPIAQLCQLIAEMLGDNPAMSQAELVKRVEKAIAFLESVSENGK